MGSLSSLLTKKQDINMNEEIEKQEDTEKHLLNKLPIGDVSNNEVAVCDHKIIKKGFHKGRCACGLFKEKQ